MDMPCLRVFSTPALSLLECHQSRMLPGLPHQFLLPFFPHGVCTLLLRPWHQPSWLRVEAGHVSIHVQAQSTLSQPSATNPLAGGEGARGCPLFLILPCPWCSPQTGPKQLEQDPVEQEWDSIPFLGLYFFPPPVLFAG